jgi:hypothetical protein
MARGADDRHGDGTPRRRQTGTFENEDDVPAD